MALLRLAWMGAQEIKNRTVHALRVRLHAMAG